MSKRLVGGIMGCKYKTSSWHLNGFPDGSNIESYFTPSTRRATRRSSAETTAASRSCHTRVRCSLECLPDDTAPENLVSRDGFGSPVPRQPVHLHTQAESGVSLRDPSRVPRRRTFIYFKPPCAIGSVPSLSGHAMAYRWRSLPRVRRHRTSKPQGSSERTSASLAGYHGPINMRLSFPHPLFV